MDEIPDVTVDSALTEGSSRLATTAAVASKVGGAAWGVGSYIAANVSTYVSNRQQTDVAANRQQTVAEVEGTGMNGLGSAEVLKIANTLDGIFLSGELSGATGELRQPEVPRLVVVGTQSSGKSSLLNAIMGANILPQGEQMVTRTPLSLQLVHISDPTAMRAEFGPVENGEWVPEDSIALSCPDPSAAQLESIRRAIETRTEARAGGQKGVSHDAIFLRLFSPHVPNLSLVDLPGLTMTALTAQGQPKDIKAQIRQMVTSYISQSRSIILMVCPARADLEADPAVELAREHDPEGMRTLGILTKIDLMNSGTDISRYLTGQVPSDLQLKLGYFAVKMRGPSERGLTVREGFGAEAEYFSKHPVYGRAQPTTAERLGVPPLTKFLARVLAQKLKQHMPAILREVSTLYMATERNLADLGAAVPLDEGSRSAMVQSMTAGFCRDFLGALVEKRANVKTGRKIKDAFHTLHSQLQAVQPFDVSEYSDAYLLEAVRDVEGNHLSFPVPPIELLEHMLTHPEKAPIQRLLPPCLACLADVHEELRSLSAQLVTKPPLSRFPKLQARLREEVEELLDQQRTTTLKKLEELISMEEAYVYTDDPAFLTELKAAVKKLVDRVDAPLLRSILTSYYQTIVHTVGNSVPKAIMLHMLKTTERSIYSTLFEAIGSQSTQGYLDEPPDVDTKRRAEMELLAKLRAAKRALETIS